MKWLWLSALVIVADQLTKTMVTQSLQYHEPIAILSGFNLTLVHNTGAAFSFLRDAGGWQRWFFIALSISISIFILIWLYRLPARRKWLACSLDLILGGAIGNLWDRIELGYVIDFIDIYYQTWHWPAFNIADSAITVGAGILIIDAFWFDGATLSTHTGNKRCN